MKLFNSHKSNFTVLMPVHDLVKIDLLKKSIYSVLNNSLRPKEFLIIVDGFMSEEKIIFLKSLKKNKIVRIFFLKKIGLVGALNYGIIKSKFNIIARADSDDINLKNRFFEQINFFIKNNLDILGSNIFEKIGKKKYAKKLTSSPSIFHFIFFNPINHMTVVFNKKKIMKLGLYPPIKYKEDYALWLLAKFSNYKLYNLNSNLVSVNFDKRRFSKRKNFESIFSEFKIFLLILEKKFILSPLAILVLILRISYLALPNSIYFFFTKNFLRIKYKS
jgi:amylovoran biosynthesis glycosyltransferase AmsE